jgi:hypothetical protein
MIPRMVVTFPLLHTARAAIAGAGVGARAKTAKAIKTT